MTRTPSSSVNSATMIAAADSSCKTFFVHPPTPPLALPVIVDGSALAGSTYSRIGDILFPVHRVYCIGQNYADHADEMNQHPAQPSGTPINLQPQKPPFFFQKAANGMLTVKNSVADFEATRTDPIILAYPKATKLFHHEVELVVCLGVDNTNPDGVGIYGYAIGLDMTRRDLQMEAKKDGLPWCSGKSFDGCGVISAIIPADQVPQGDTFYSQYISLKLNGELKQRTQLHKMTHRIDEMIKRLSEQYDLQPGDVIFTGTPGGVGPVKIGDVIDAKFEGFVDLKVRVE